MTLTPSVSDGTGSRSRSDDPEGGRSVPADDLLDLLGDEYARRVLVAVTGGPTTVREVVEATDVSRPTAYRRLDRLERAGLVEAETVPDPDGHHCTRYWTVVEEASLRLTDEGIRATVSTSSEEE